MAGEPRLSVVRRAAAAVTLSIGLLVGSLTFAAPAQAAQEVARVQPCWFYSGAPQCAYRDDHVTLVKYYSGSSGRYQFCVANYHHTGEVTDWLAYVDWYDNNGNYQFRENIPLP